MAPERDTRPTVGLRLLVAHATEGETETCHDFVEYK